VRASCIIKCNRQKFNYTTSHKNLTKIFKKIVLTDGGIIFYFDLTLKNVSIVYGIKFILIFVISYLPNFIVSQNVSIKVVNYSIIIFTFLLFITGIILINNVDSEKVILS
jgi:hypothetical protein